MQIISVENGGNHRGETTRSQRQRRAISHRPQCHAPSPLPTEHQRQGSTRRSISLRTVGRKGNASDGYRHASSDFLLQSGFNFNCRSLSHSSSRRWPEVGGKQAAPGQIVALALASSDRLAAHLAWRTTVNPQ
ncbi:hypothetical protein LIA77_03074 [Sarocladium implicatum]|nr:hypothetical protein LIA77_03074 [Sarocladium implicatum]